MKASQEPVNIQRGLVLPSRVALILFTQNIAMTHQSTRQDMRKFLLCSANLFKELSKRLPCHRSQVPVDTGPELVLRLAERRCFQTVPLPAPSQPVLLLIPAQMSVSGRTNPACGQGFKLPSAEWTGKQASNLLNISMALPPIPKCHEMSIQVHQTLLVSTTIPKQSQKTCSDSVHTRLQVGTDLNLFFFHFVHGGAFRLCFHSLVNLFWELCCSLLCKCVLVCLVLPEQTQNWLLHMAYRSIYYQILPEHTATMFQRRLMMFDVFRTIQDSK